METVSKFLSGMVGGSAVSSMLLFVFRGQNKRIDEKVDVKNCKIIARNMDEKIGEIKADVKDIKEIQTAQLISFTEAKTILNEIKHGMSKRRKDDSG